MSGPQSEDHQKNVAGEMQVWAHKTQIMCCCEIKRLGMVTIIYDSSKRVEIAQGLRPSASTHVLTLEMASQWMAIDSAGWHVSRPRLMLKLKGTEMTGLLS